MSAADIHELIHGSNGEVQRLYQKIRDEKEKQMNNFIEAHGSAPLQRSDEWFLMRKKVIGASEFAALVGMSPYQNFESLARKKKRRKQFIIFELIMLVGYDIRRCCS